MSVLVSSHFLFFCTAVFGLQPFGWSSKADISCVVVDLKYNIRDGVKICEVQPACFSRFSGSDFLEGSEVISHRYCDFIAKYNLKGFFIHPLYRGMKKVFVERGWTSIHQPEQLLTTSFPHSNVEEASLYSYQACLFSLEQDRFSAEIINQLPYVLFLDRAILSYAKSKYLMNRVLDQFPSAKKLRPSWRAYRKGFSKELVQTIMSEIPGDIIVIKPIESTMGRGVIIVEKKDLESTLLYIFGSPKERLIEDMDRSYSHYAVDPSDGFIVEEFISSDPLFFGDPLQPYDCTMRLILMLSYDRAVPEVLCLGKYWYSPQKPLDSKFTLNQSHKAKGVYFSKVDEKTSREVEKQLYPALLQVYEAMVLSL